MVKICKHQLTFGNNNSLKSCDATPRNATGGSDAHKLLRSGTNIGYVAIVISQGGGLTHILDSINLCNTSDHSVGKPYRIGQ